MRKLVIIFSVAYLLFDLVGDGRLGHCKKHSVRGIFDCTLIELGRQTFNNQQAVVAIFPLPTLTYQTYYTLIYLPIFAGVFDDQVFWGVSAGGLPG